MVRVGDQETLNPYRCGFDSRQGLQILSCKEAIHLAYSSSVVPASAWNNTGAPEVFLQKVKLESRHITFTALVRHKSQANIGLKYNMRIHVSDNYFNKPKLLHQKNLL